MNSDLKRTCIRSYVDQELIDSLHNELAGNTDLRKDADIFSLLGDFTRLRILYCLSRTDELCVCDLSDIIGMGVSAISHQLRKLKDRNLVKNRRDGLTIYYSISKSDVVTEACDLLESIIKGTKVESIAV